MLLKGKRTFESMMNAIAHHFHCDDTWDLENDDPDSMGDIVFGVEWQGKVVMHKDVVYGVELYHENYKDLELAVVEKAIGLLEGIEWSAETGEEMKPEVRKRPKMLKRDLEVEE